MSTNVASMLAQTEVVNMGPPVLTCLDPLGVTVLPTGMAFCALHLLMTAPVHPIKPCADMVLVSMKLTPM